MKSHKTSRDSWKPTWERPLQRQGLSNKFFPIVPPWVSEEELWVSRSVFEISPIKLEKNLTEIGAVSHAKKIYFYSVIHKKTKEEESTVDSALMRKIETRGQELYPTP